MCRRRGPLNHFLF
ncbi:Protein CBG27747 [Caenorhabditis briggsae]|uniref:Protein CBG27747 n=1 Tax=Caenorhabditis briggsae TaxID=6238 RepID=B6IJ45_CAEBR|nr:Protein CBG27747 [Caenorhabditis briggsae]CAS00025.1 Protein CBG27747 [Caenorhabditis briggsae]